MKSVVFLFGEAEKGEFGMPLHCRSLPEVAELLGNPPEASMGISYAVQAILFHKELLFCRVEEEGFSIHDYTRGLYYLRERREQYFPSAVMMPGVGSEELVDAAFSLCNPYKSILVLNEKDLYDYLTESGPTIVK